MELFYLWLGKYERIINIDVTDEALNREEIYQHFPSVKVSDKVE